MVSCRQMVTDAGSDFKWYCCRFSGGKSTIDDKLVEAKRQFRMERMIWILSVIMRPLKWRYRFS
jgi:hypothetical protein